MTSETRQPAAASAGTGIKWFFVITLIYFIIKHITGTFSFSGSLLLFSCYYALVLISQTIINIENSKKICGSSQAVLWSTFVNWVLLFGGFLFLLMIFPGWCTPFSNSIGYALSVFAGSDGLLREVINPNIMNFDVNFDEKTKNDNSENIKQIKKLTKLYLDDPSYLINEIPLDLRTDGEWIFWNEDKHDSIISDKKEIVTDISKSKSLYNLLYIKESTAQFIWYMLIGILASLTNFNYILTTDCIKSLEEIENENSNYDDNENDDTGE